MCKAISPTKEQAEPMKHSGINFPFLWMVIGDFPSCFLVKNIITREEKFIDKQ